MINMQNQGSKESLAVKFKKRIYAKLCLKVWFKSGWYFCNITKSGWFWKRLITSLSHFRSSRTQMFFKIDVFRNFAIFTGKHQKFRNIYRKTCWGLILKNLQALRATTLFKRDFITVVSCEYFEIFTNKSSFFYGTLPLLLLLVW